MAASTPSGPRTLAQRAGDAAEDEVAALLVGRGWRLLGRRVRAGRSELDLVMVDPGPPAALVIVEVRWRRCRDYGLPEETVDRRKVGHLRAGAGRIQAAGRLPDGTSVPDLPVRLDLVAVEPPALPGGRVRVRHHRGIG